MREANFKERGCRPVSEKDIDERLKKSSDKLNQLLPSVKKDEVNEGHQPIYVNAMDKPDAATIQTPDKLQKFNDTINDRTPSWLHVYYTKEKGDKPLPTIKYKIDVVRLGDALIKNDHLISFPAVESGAMYQPKLGVWRLFKNNEAFKYVGSRLTHVVRRWGVYSDRDVTSVQKYVLRKMLNTDQIVNPFDHSKPNLVAFENGTFNFDTGKLEKSRPENYLVNGHDYNLDTSNKATPNTDKLLRAMVGDADTFVKEFIGYGFYHSYQPFQKIVFFYGSGGEGKSTFLIDLLAMTIFGDGNYSAVPPEELAGNQNRFKTAQLYNHEMNIVADIDKGYLANTAILKKLSGGDPMDAEYKGTQNFTFVNYAKLIFSANELPSFSDTTNGIRERMVVIPFINGNTRTDNKDFWNKHDMKKVKEEREAFVYQCIIAFRRALRRRKMTETAQMKRDRNEWIELNDHFGQFIQEGCEIDTSSDAGESVTRVTAEYTAFCRENNYSEKTTSATIRNNLKRYGVVKAKRRKGYGADKNSIWRYIGLKLLKEYLKPDDADYYKSFEK
ncbi:DNA primase family protein [Lactiplantibacillus plantarum]|nr:phage/plasmid primase, P4 family [Lactiplantibacillus plantarum]